MARGQEDHFASHAYVSRNLAKSYTQTAGGVWEVGNELWEWDTRRTLYPNPCLHIEKRSCCMVGMGIGYDENVILAMGMGLGGK